MCHFIGNFFLARSVLLFPYSSQKITDRPRNTHSCCNSKSKKKRIPSIFQCSHSISFHNAVHTIIKSTSGNQRDYGSTKKDVDVSLQILARISAYTSVTKPAIRVGRKTFPQNSFPRRNTSQLRKPPTAARGKYSFYMKKNSKSYRANGSGN